MDEAYKSLLTRQGYHMCGEHTGVKVCDWTRKAIRNQGICYKQRFYGINSHRCVQMSPAMNMCAMDCIYCWRDRNETTFGKKIDSPEEIITKCIAGHNHSLIGFKGNHNVNSKRYLESTLPKHFAISLSGEPTAYPRLPELITALHAKGITTFLVTNGMFPEMLSQANPTQLYLSYDTPIEEIFYKMDRPDLRDAWARLNRSIEIMREKRATNRTVMRITLVKGLNDNHHEEMARVIERMNPLAIEIKSYMHVGASRNRLGIKNMPRHQEVVAYSKEIERHCGYRIIDTQEASRVTLMMRPEDASMRMIDYSESDKLFTKWTDSLLAKSIKD